MANYSISASELTEGTTVHIRGKLGFARLTRLIEGDDLAKSDQRKVQNGMSPVGKPHTTATITEAEVVFADPANPTTEEKFVSERRYVSKKNPDTGANYSIDSKGNNLPVIGIKSPNGNWDQDESGQELAQGSDVTLVLRVYKPKSFNNRGLALDQVLVNDAEPRYYNGGGAASTADLAARGIVFNAPPKAVQAPTAGSGSAVGGEDPVGTVVEDGLSFPAPQPSVPEAVPAAAPAQAQAQPAAAPTPAQVQAQPAAPAEESMEQKLARLEAENRAMKDAGGSAVGAPVSDGPWNQGGQGEQAGITYQG